MAQVELLQIGEVAEVVGLSLRTIRHYDDVGLVPPSERSDGGFRLYSRRDVERLLFVRQMKPLEFTLEEMTDLLEVRDRLTGSAVGSKERDALLDTMIDFVAVAEQRCDRLRQKLEMAESVTAMLRDEAERAGPHPLVPEQEESSLGE